MTSSQEPQLTRREMRERERLQEQAASPTPESAPQHQPTPLPQAPVVPVTPLPSPAPSPVPAYSAPTQAAGATRPPQGTPYGGAPQGASAYPTPAAPPANAPSAFAPAPAAAAAPSSSPYPAPAQYPGTSPAAQPPIPQQPQGAPSQGAPSQGAPRQASTPERTLTRRELRAMLDADGPADGGDELDDLDQEIAGASAMDAPRAPAAFTPASAAPQGLSPAALPEPPFRQPLPHQAEAAAFAEQPTAAPKPVGHWTAQLDAPIDQAQPFDQMLSRGGVGRGVPTTTNALILPSLPDHAGIPAPLANTGNGEVIVTGSIDLPRSYGATGVHPSQIDSSDVDRLFDQVEDGAGVGAPVAATRAISTQSASKALVAPPSKEGMNVPLVLAVTAGVLALGVVGTLVVGALTGLF